MQRPTYDLVLTKSLLHLSFELNELNFGVKNKTCVTHRISSHTIFQSQIFDITQHYLQCLQRARVSVYLHTTDVCVNIHRRVKWDRIAL